MDTVFWVILIVVAVGIVWWLLNRNSSPKSEPGESATGSQRADGALSSGGAAASAEAAGIAGIATAAGFGRPAEPAAPTTAEEPAQSSAPEASASGRGQSGSTAVPDAPAPSPAPAPAPAPAPQASSTPAASHQDDSQDSRGTARDELRRQDQAEWETQWSEASGGSVPPRATAATTPAAEPVPHAATEPPPNAAEAAPTAPPVHHPEYTEPHAPTLPGAETAAIEEADEVDAGRLHSAAPATAQGARTAHQAIGGTEADGGPAGAGAASSVGVPPEAAAAETRDRAQSSAVVEAGADHGMPAGRPDAEAGTRIPVPESTGHLAADEPYGAGSAAAGADGGGPADYAVKGDAGSMVYYEEGHPDFDQTRADVWFESAAHAEAAGFRAPRRRRL